MITSNIPVDRYIHSEHGHNVFRAFAAVVTSQV
jgi:hypothetical protein